MLNLLGSAIYLAVVLACLFALFAAMRWRGSGGDARSWLLSAVFFAAMAASRYFELEDVAQAQLRSLISQGGLYGSRWLLQAPFVLLTLAGGALIAGRMFARWRRARRSRTSLSVLAAQVGVAGYALLVLIRVISLHATDWVLYSGPIHPNWLIDGGLAALVGAAASYYTLRCSSRRRAAR